MSYFRILIDINLLILIKSHSNKIYSITINCYNLYSYKYFDRYLRKNILSNNNLKYLKKKSNFYKYYRKNVNSDDNMVHLYVLIGI